MDTIFLRLLLAHIISDFILQGAYIANNKKGKALKNIVALTIHSSIHAILAYLFVGDIRYYFLPITIFLTHFIIDYIKSNYMADKLRYFFIDQFLHIIVILLIWLYLAQINIDTIFATINPIIQSNTVWIILLSYILILQPTSVTLEVFFKRWSRSNSGLSLNGLPDAGKWIGYFERILILTLILSGYIEGVGFLLAAKSIFRFGELKNASEIKVTEYVLIGTLSSFTIATIIGLITKLFL